MYVAQMKPKLLISIGRCGKLMLDFQVVRQVVRQANETTYFHELSGKLETRQVAWISPSATKKRSILCIRHIECDIKDFTKMVDEFRTKNIVQNTDYSQKIISILHIYIHTYHMCIHIIYIHIICIYIYSPGVLVPLLHHAHLSLVENIVKHIYFEDHIQEINALQ